MALFGDNKALIDLGADLGMKKYTLTQDGEIQLGSFSAKNTTLNRWAINKKAKQQDKSVIIELFTLESAFKGEVNEVFKSTEAVNKVFKQIYNELEVSVNSYGELSRVLNHKQMKDKWINLKKELVTIESQKLPFDQILKLNDNIFDNYQLLHNVVSANEFFSIFCNCIYGKNPPFSSSRKSRNLLSTGEIQFNYQTELTHEDDKNYKIAISGNPEQISDSKKMELYKEFKFLDPYLKALKPVHIYKAEYVVDKKSGWIQNAKIRAEEIVHPGLLYSSMDFKLEIDN
ncbi:MAG: hypothetical protein QM726_23130 [Chitinophagaceae bacterium]